MTALNFNGPQPNAGVAMIFPREIREDLVRAATLGDRTLRYSAVERATERAKLKCPHLFKKEPT